MLDAGDYLNETKQFVLQCTNPLSSGQADRSKVGIENAATLLPLPESKRKLYFFSVVTMMQCSVHPQLNLVCAIYRPNFENPSQLLHEKTGDMQEPWKRK